jgi:hypothetical protein
MNRSFGHFSLSMWYRGLLFQTESLWIWNVWRQCTLRQNMKEEPSFALGIFEEEGGDMVRSCFLSAPNQYNQ